MFFPSCLPPLACSSGRIQQWPPTVEYSLSGSGPPSPLALRAQLPGGPAIQPHRCSSSPPPSRPPATTVAAVARPEPSRAQQRGDRVPDDDPPPCHELWVLFPIRRRHLLYSPERVQLSPSVVAATAAQRRGGAGVSAGAGWTPVSVWQKTTLPPEATATGGGALPASRMGTVGDARATAVAVCNNRMVCPRSRELAAAWRLQCVPRRPLAWTRRHASGRGERRCCRPTPGLAAQSNGPLSSASASMAASRCATRTGANTSSASYAYHCCHTSKKREVQRTALERAALSSFVLDWSAVTHICFGGCTPPNYNISRTTCSRFLEPVKALR